MRPDVLPLARQRFERDRLAHARLTGLREAALAQDAEVSQKVAQAKGRLALDEETQLALDGLQARAHERSVGVFERLLSAILADVLPHKGAVRMELGTERGLPALDVQIDNQGQREDALDGSGGAVTNVLVAGLRFAALSRTGNRRFMVLDEPDCWLKPERVGLFIRVLAEVAERAATQTLLISHHEPALFEGLVNLVRLVRGEDGPEAQPLEPRVSSWANNEDPGLRSIRLIHFRAHRDTLIPLSPGVTALIGDNDLGKSTAAIAALRAVAYGESDDSVIRHGQTEAKVILTLERDQRIEWVRRLKGSPRVTYAVYEGETLRHEGRPAGRGLAPEWVTSLLGVTRVDELDIQLGSQKEPVFLLNEPASTRAKLLSVGRESGRLHQLIEDYGDVRRRDREQVRDGEARIIRLRYQIGASAGLAPQAARLEALAGTLQTAEATSARLTRLTALLGRLATLTDQRARLARRLATLESLPAAPPALADLRPLTRVLDGLARTRRGASLRPTWPVAGVPDVRELRPLARVIQTLANRGPVARLRREFPTATVPVLVELERLRGVGTTLARLGARVLADPPDLTVPAPPALTDTAELTRTGARLATRQAALATFQGEAEAAAAAWAASRTELEALAEALGGLCPLCDSALPASLGGHAHRHGEGDAA